MSVYRDLWALIKSGLEGNAALTAYLAGKPIIWGNQEVQVNSFPAILIDLADKPLEEDYVAVPGRKSGALKIFVAIKCRNQNSASLITAILEGIEIILNAFESLYPNAKILTVKIPTDVSLNTLATDVKDAMMEVTIQSQHFNRGQR
jgi:hypothetical protein